MSNELDDWCKANGTRPDLPLHQNVSHLLKPIIGQLCYARDGHMVIDDKTMDYYIVRLELVIVLAEEADRLADIED